MDSGSVDIDILDMVELLNFTFSKEFIDKWRHKYSTKFLSHFQLRLLETFQKNKPIKITTLYTYLTKKCKYNRKQVLNFFESIEIEIYRPVIYGKLTEVS